jgi:hypothetical protein
MAFDVYYTRSPGLDALMAFQVGRGDALRQNDLIESQRQFAATQRTAQSIGGGVGQAANFLFQAALANQGAETRLNLEQLRQEGAGERQEDRQQALEDAAAVRGVPTVEQLSQWYPGTPASEASGLYRVYKQYQIAGLQAPEAFRPQRAQGQVVGGGVGAAAAAQQFALQQQQQQQAAAIQQQYDGVVQQAAKQAGLEKGIQPPTMKNIAQSLNGLDRALGDQTLSLPQKAAAIQKVTRDLQTHMTPKWGQRTSPPTVQEAVQSGQAAMIQGYDHPWIFDADGIRVKAGNALSRSAPDLSTPEKRQAHFAANTMPFGDGGLAVWNGKAQKYEALVKPGSGDQDKIVRQRRIDAEKELQTERKGTLGGFLGPPIESQQVIERARENALENEEIAADMQERKDIAKVESVQHELDQGGIPEASAYILGGVYYYPHGSAWKRMKFVGIQNGQPVFETSIVDQRPR